MKVLYVHSGNLFGGVETLMLTLARNRLLCPEMEPHFALCFEGRLSRQLSALGVTVHLIGRVKIRNPLSAHRAKAKLRLLLSRESFDVAITHSAWSQAIFGATIRAAGLPLVFWLHGRVTGRHWLEQWAKRTPPNLAICNSHFTASTLDNLYPSVRRHVIYCPSDGSNGSTPADVKEKIREEFSTGPHQIVIAQASRLEEGKGHVLHLNALGMLKDIPGWVCWLIGDVQRPGERRYKKKLQNVANSLGIADRVRFVGDRSDVPKLLEASDIFCQPNSLPESFGLSFIEALSAGVPVVTTSIGGAKEIVDPSCGFLVPPGDVHGLALTLKSLIVDSDLRQRLGAHGPERAHLLCHVQGQIQQLHNSLATVC